MGREAATHSFVRFPNQITKITLENLMLNDKSLISPSVAAVFRLNGISV